MRVTAIFGSPRRSGNTDLLMQSFLRGLRECGAQAHEIVLRDLSFSPCIECGGCDATGNCVLDDDMNSVYPALQSSDVIVLSAPVFFYGLNAHAKAMIDRCQCFYVRKYVLNQPPAPGRASSGTGILLTAGGSRGKKNFDGILLTVRYFFDALGMDFTRHLAYAGIDARGAVHDHPGALEEACELGRSIGAQSG